MMKKGMSFNIWLAIIIALVGAVLIMSFTRFFGDISERSSEIAFQDFLVDLEKKVETMRDNYGTVDTVDYFVGSDYNRLCFSQYGMAQSRGIVNQELFDLINSSIQKNIFVLDDEAVRSFYMQGIIIEKLGQYRFGCYEVEKGKVSIRFEARGAGTLIGPPFNNTEFSDCVIKVPDVMNTKTMRPDRWHLDQRYFVQDDTGKVVTACGPAGWEDVELIT